MCSEGIHFLYEIIVTIRKYVQMFVILKTLTDKYPVFHVPLIWNQL